MDGGAQARPSLPADAPAVIAHRGASAAHPPGNTLAALAASGPLGASWVELDVRRCADDTLAVHHDEHLPDGRALVRLRRHELPDWVPALEAALEASAGLGVNIEIKNSPRDGDFDPAESLAEAVVALVERRGVRADQPLLVSSFHAGTVEAVRRLDPSLSTARLSIRLDARRLEAAAAAGHTAVHPTRHWVTASLVTRAHDLGLAVNMWTVEPPLDHPLAGSAGVDGVITNVPDVAVAALATG